MRLIPVIVVLSVLALAGRVVALYTEFNPTLTPSVSALDASPFQEQEEEDDKDEDESDDTAPSDTPPAELPAADGYDFADFATCTEEDIRLVEQLRQRRLVLDKRADELEIRENLLAATEERIQDSTARLVELEQLIKSHLKLFDEREQKQLDRIVQVYTAMNPKDAAPRFEALAPEIQVDLATAMKPKTIAAIISKMSQKKATALTEELATIASAPTLEDVQGSP